MKIGVVVLVRLSSKRLPRKALRTIEAKEILLYIIERLNRVLDKSNIIIATSSDIEDDAIEKFARTHHLEVYRGSLNDVSQRFYDAAARAGFDFATRINGDNVFVDINLLTEMIHIAEKNEYDFISNVKNRTYPKGMSIEIIRTSHYAQILSAIKHSDYHKEHVTSYLYENEEKGSYKFVLNNNLPDAAGIQLALDTQEDWVRTEKIIRAFKKHHWEYNLTEILPIWKSIQNEKFV